MINGKLSVDLKDRDRVLGIQLNNEKVPGLLKPEERILLACGYSIRIPWDATEQIFIKFLPHLCALL